LGRPKMSTLSPYRKIAVASTFSPRFEQVLSEAKRIRDRFGAVLSLIYVGDQTEITSKKFRAALSEVGLPEDSIVHYEAGDPAEEILRAIRQNHIDIIIAGALEKEVVLHPFLGNVARRLVREANCSVMLFTNPERQPKPMKHMVFVADYCDHARNALIRSFEVASGEGCERLYVSRVVTTFDRARAKAGASGGKTQDDEEIELEEFILSAGHTEVPIEARLIRGNTGFAIADFAKSVNADLLIVPVATAAGESLPPKIAWLTDVIPCNLWLIR
jgi:nucleotide-binding universal stress UspA family protein